MTVIWLLALLPLVSSISLIPRIGRAQSVEVTGILKCEHEPSRNTRVKLYDKEILLDKKLAEVTTDSEGHFKISGHTHEISSIDPKINIYHKCKRSLPCDIKLSITIPKSYITEGKVPQRTFDIGEINLAGGWKGQSTDCIN